MVFTGFTHHARQICALRDAAASPARSRLESLALLTAAELLAAHDETGISLDDWVAPRDLVEYLLESRIIRNGV